MVTVFYLLESITTVIIIDITAQKTDCATIEMTPITVIVTVFHSLCNNNGNSNQ